jgi:hypothetical protein
MDVAEVKFQDNARQWRGPMACADPSRAERSAALAESLHTIPPPVVTHTEELRC